MKAAKNPFILLIVIALIAGSFPATLLGEVGSDPQDDACSGLDDVCCEGEESGGSHPKDDDCCPSGCDDCYLACCAGIISVLPSGTVLASGQKAIFTISPYHSDPTPDRERDIDHPPRA